MCLYFRNVDKEYVFDLVLTEFIQNFFFKYKSTSFGSRFGENSYKLSSIFLYLSIVVELYDANESTNLMISSSSAFWMSLFSLIFEIFELFIKRRVSDGPPLWQIGVLSTAVLHSCSCSCFWRNCLYWSAHKFFCNTNSSLLSKNLNFMN